jgi:hypothetical protein
VGVRTVTGIGDRGDDRGDGSCGHGYYKKDQENRPHVHFLSPCFWLRNHLVISSCFTAMIKSISIGVLLGSSATPTAVRA